MDGAGPPPTENNEKLQDSLLSPSTLQHPIQHRRYDRNDRHAIFDGCFDLLRPHQIFPAKTTFMPYITFCIKMDNPLI